MLTHYILPKAALVLTQQGWVVVTETIWPTKPKIFISGFFLSYPWPMNFLSVSSLSELEKSLFCLLLWPWHLYLGHNRCFIPVADHSWGLNRRSVNCVNMDPKLWTQLHIWNHCFLGMYVMNSCKEICNWPKNTLGRILGPRNSFIENVLASLLGLLGAEHCIFYSPAMLNKTCAKSPGRPGAENLGNIWRIRV